MLPLIIAENTEASSATQLNITLQLASQTNNTFQAGADWPLGALAADLACCLVFVFSGFIIIFFYFLLSQCAKVIIFDCGIPW